MNLRTLRHSFIFYSARALIFLSGLAPRSFHSALARLLAWSARILARREWRLCQSQISNNLLRHRNDTLARQLTFGVFVQLAKSTLELCALMRRPYSPLRVSFSPGSAEALQNALDENRGVVFITGHIGNWELMAIFLSQQGFPIHTIAAGSYDPRFTRYIEERRARFGVKAIYREQPDSATKILRALKGNSVLGFLIDQDTRVKSVFVPFFNSLASTPAGAAELAIRTGTPVVVGSIHRKTDGAHLITIEPISLPADIAEATAQLTSTLEARIRRHPSQWVWLHRRWKTRPE